MNTPSAYEPRPLGIISRREYRGYTIAKRIFEYSYPRNGNVHNPTPYVLWEVHDSRGRVIDSLPRLRDAKASVDAIVDDTPMIVQGI